MYVKVLGAVLVSALIAGASTIASAQQAPASGKKIDLGQREYDSKCASCHGLLGKGDGPNAPWLKRNASDLTVLAKNNNGVFPVARLYDVIDGSREVAGHGTGAMPTWGREYRIQAAEYYYEFPYDPEFYVRSRILAVIEYIYRLQAK